MARGLLLSLWLSALLALALTRETAATTVHVRVRARNHGRSTPAATPSAAAPNVEDAAAAKQRVTCPAANSTLARVTTPAITTACPKNCPSNNLCIFYPQNFPSQCATTRRRMCYHGDTCAFQCIPNADRKNGWFLSLYNDAAVVDEVNLWNGINPDTLSVGINISLVSQWADRIELPNGTVMFYVTGNEAANDINFDGEYQDLYFQDQVSRPKGSIVPFEMPPSLYQDVQRLQFLRLENIKAPAVSPDIAKGLVFPALTELYMRNTMLTSFPLAQASFPALTTLDLSMNSITEITRSALPNTLVRLNLSFNAISHLGKGLFPQNLTIIDVASNSISSIPKGTLPLGLEQLYLDRNSLTEVPPDVAEMPGLVNLFMDGNMLKEIPAKALPPLSMDSLSLINCSLTAVPRVIKAMTGLTILSLKANDLSRDPDFSVLPESLVQLSVDYSRLSKFPSALQNLVNLESLFMAGNPNAVADLTALPESLTELDLSDNALEVVPKGVADLSLSIIYLELNPLGKLAPDTLPSTLNTISMSNAKFTEVKSGTLPDSLTSISIVDSALQVAPEDIRAMQTLELLAITNCSLESFDVANALPGLASIDLSSNRITRFVGRYAALTYLDLRSNTLREFNVSYVPLMQTLHLADNNLTSFPASIFGMDELLLLNLSGNPIRGFSPNVDQIASLARIQVVVLDQAMFSTDCDAEDLMDVRGYSVCSPNASNAANLQQQKPSSSKISVGLVLLNVCLAAALAMLVATVWRRRALQKKRLQDLDAKTASLEKMQRHQSSASIWSDTVLLQNRLDEDLVERKRLLGSGMYGEVWLAIYKNERFALKRLKQTGDIERQQINDFVEEIKLLSSLSHPCVVRFVGVVWTKESDIAMVTEYMAGGDLRSYLDENPKIDNGWTMQMVRVALNITEALVYLHSLESVVIHRDLKSRNVLLDAKLRAKLSDFGISRYKLDDETMTAAVGTIRWVAPEVMAGQRYDESVDIYSLGIILSEIDTHKLPFDDLTDESGHERLTDSAIAGLLLSGSLSSSFSESCPSEIRSLATRCTAFAPADRPTGLQVAYELRMMLKNASAWTNSNGTFISSSSIGDDAVGSAATANSGNLGTENTGEETPALTHVSI